MANYIGSAPRSGEFKKLDAIASLFNGSTTEFALRFNGVSVQVGDATQLMVSINGVIQEPLVSYTLGTGGSKIVFLTPPPSNASCFITLFGGVGGTVTPSDSSVTVAKLVPSLAADINAKALAADVTSALALKADQTTVDTSLALKADKSNVLALNNTTAYSPTSNYHPATKGYVDALASSGGGNVSITRGFTFTGTGAQTTFDCGAANSYILGAVDVYHNGMQLDGSDYTAADGRNFTLTSLTPASGDIIKLVAYGGADVYNKTQTNTLLDAKANLGGATFTGALQVNSTLYVGATAARSFALYSDTSSVTIEGIDRDNNLSSNKKNITLNPYGGNVSVGTNSPVGKFHTVLDTGRTLGNNWDSKTALFGGAGNTTVGALGISYDDTNGARIEALSPAVAWRALTVNANSIDLRTSGSQGGVYINSNGVVTTPRQPGFSAYKGTTNVLYGTGTPVKFTEVQTNQGNYYDPGTGLFTAGIAGLYHFEAGGITHDVTNYYYIGFAYNGDANHAKIKGSWRHLPFTAGEYSFMHTSLTIYLNQYDTIAVYNGFNGGSPYLEGNRSSFSGYLIG